MARKPSMPATGELQPDSGITDGMIEQAFEAYQVTQLAARDNPGLTDNPYFCAIQDSAYARFALLMGGA